MGSYLNPGSMLFRGSLRSKIYIDKSGLIEKINELVCTEQKYVCVSRPRRFGKSMAANMLAAYYKKDEDTKPLFDKLLISQAKSYEEHLNQYDVIRINMQQFLSETHNMEEMLSKLRNYLIMDLQEAYEKIRFREKTSLVQTMKDVFAYTGCPFIILIDEWDCLFREYQKDKEAQKKYLDFLRAWLKDQDYVGLAYMTGILPITLCQEYGMSFEETKAWYNGYGLWTHSRDGDQFYSMYSPKSVVEAMLRHKFGTYWNQTETYEALKVYIQMNMDGLKDSVVEMLAGGSVRINTGTFSNDMTTFATKDDVLTLLVHLGYLTYDSLKEEVSIPNKEVSKEYVNAISTMDWKEVITSVEASRKLLNSLWDMNEEAVAEGIDKAHREISILQYNDENSLSCTINLAFYFAREYYTIVRELPTGKGFADICFIPRKIHADKPAVVLELKWDKNAKGAISQIKEKDYVDALKDYHGNLLLAGINYDKKTKKHSCIIEKMEKV